MTASEENFLIKVAKKVEEFKDYSPIPLIILLLIFARPTALTATIGLAIISLGVIFRVFTISHIIETRKNHPDNTFKVYESGPYRFIRSPLYTGNLLIAAGLSLFSGVLNIFIATLAIGIIQLILTLYLDEHNYIKTYGDKYREYRKKVPAIIPIKIPTKKEIFRPREFSPAIEKEVKTVGAIAIIILVLLVFH